MPTLKPLSRFTLLPALLSLAACQSGAYDGPSVPELVSLGEYEEAVRIGARLHEETPDDEQTELEYRDASVAMLLELARRATFQDRDTEALAFIAQAKELDPENRIVLDWELKAKLKLSSIWLDRALDFGGRGDLASAIESYEKALSYDPASSAALQGVGRMLLLSNYREGRGQEYYREGVRALRSYWLHQARANFTFASSKFIPGDEASTERTSAVQELLAEGRVEKAESFEADGLYFAAGNEYRLALLLDPSSKAAMLGRDRMNNEAGAASKLEHAEWLRMRGRYDEARVTLSEGLELTNAQAGLFEVGSIDIEEEEFRILYDEARRLESDYQYPRSIEVYTELLDVAGYYQDAITRRIVLKEAITQVEDLYARAMETKDDEERIGYLQQIQLVWPEFENVDQLLEELGVED